MKKIVLSQEESCELLETGSVEITRNGFDMIIEKNDDDENGYSVYVTNPSCKIVFSRR